MTYISLPKGLLLATENKNCQVPTLNTDQCYNTRFWECPRFNGSYKQCTNNYMPKEPTGRCDCRNRTFEMCPEKYKVSDKCIYLF
jgi:hypothetical protein